MITDFFSSRTSYKLITAEDGEIALDLIQNDPPDLIILDVVLPRINGIALLHDLRKIKATENTPVIMISGEMIDEHFKRQGFELGAADYLEKPFDLEYLLNKVNSLLAPENS